MIPPAPEWMMRRFPAAAGYRLPSSCRIRSRRGSVAGKQADQDTSRIERFEPQTASPRRRRDVDREGAESNEPPKLEGVLSPHEEFMILWRSSS